MVNSQSTIALYGADNILLSMKEKVSSIGISLISFPQLDSQSELGSQMRDIVNSTAALVILKSDANLASIVHFYFAANKKVYLLSESETLVGLPKGVKLVSSLIGIVKDLLKETESAIIDTRIGKIELRFNSFGLYLLKTSKQAEVHPKPSKLVLKVKKQLDDFFDGKRKSFNLKVFLKGTEFQRKVWEQLLKIPFGHTVSYGDLAVKLGDSNASRAVGLANSKNPIWIVVPCHRVLSKEGDLTGYAGGLKLKQFLLDLESNQMSLFN